VCVCVCVCVCIHTYIRSVACATEAERRGCSHRATPSCTAARSSACAAVSTGAQAERSAKRRSASRTRSCTGIVNLSLRSCSASHALHKPRQHTHTHTRTQDTADGRFAAVARLAADEARGPHAMQLRQLVRQLGLGHTFNLMPRLIASVWCGLREQMRLLKPTYLRQSLAAVRRLAPARSQPRRCPRSLPNLPTVGVGAFPVLWQTRLPP
jgi:hypothetical protein